MSGKRLGQAERYWIDSCQDKIQEAQRELQVCLLTILKDRGEDTALNWEFVKDDNGKIAGYKRGSEDTELDDANEGDAGSGDN